MGDLSDTRIRIIKSDEVVWEEAMPTSGDTDPPGEECVCAASVDDRFSFGLWRRDAQHRRFERPYHEIAYIIGGEVEIVDDDGNRHVAGPGDILVTPKGSVGSWKNLTPVKKVWGIYDEPDASLNPYTGPGPF